MQSSRNLIFLNSRKNFPIWRRSRRMESWSLMNAVETGTSSINKCYFVRTYLSQEGQHHFEELQIG